jgi:diaminopimelate decarboxylase
VAEIAKSVETPFYCYSSSAIRQAYARWRDAMAPLEAEICFAVKANANLAVLRILADLGCGADIVSAGELLRSRLAGIPPEKIIFSGVGKMADEIHEAVITGIRQINVETNAELDTIVQASRAARRRTAIALRVNPDVNARTHAKITTGTRHSKFGIGLGEVPTLYRAAASHPELNIVGLAIHIGSQLVDLEPFRQAFQVVAELVLELRASGFSVSHLDLGGGLGVSYDGSPGPDLSAYVSIVRQTVGDLGCKLTVEPGRSLIAEAGNLITKVIYEKAADPTFAIVDAAMNDFMRPALYDAVHQIVPVRIPEIERFAIYDVVGPVCESTDIFARSLELPRLAPGDLLAIRCVGAYGAVLASSYNARPLVPEVLVDDREFAVVRDRQPVEAMISLERMPRWLRAHSSPAVGPDAHLP